MTTADPATSDVPLEEADYGNPTRECDIVMKGGITSGVVYPLAVCEMARDYRFRCIGGTSAGAIAAAATAAAELGRSRGGTGFQELARLPKRLGRTEKGADRSNLFALFQPQPGTDPIFDVAIASLGESQGRMGRVLRRLLARFSVPALLAAVPGVAVAALGTQARPFLAAAVLVALGLALAGGGAIGMAAWSLARRVRTELPRNGFGLCSGNGREVGDADGPAALTPWMADLLNGLAGKPKGRDPLTFGDLWNPRHEDGEPTVDLRFMTTNLTHGRPYELPFASRELYYDPAEFRTLFPGWVVDWMDARADELMAQRRAAAEAAAERKRERAAKKAAAAALGPDVDEEEGEDDEAEMMEAELSAEARADAEALAEAAGEAEAMARAQWKRLRPLPLPEHLPVVVAARLSLSFPVLISAVPLYAVDFTRRRPREQHYPERCWFSDGGICSNFPVHFFDAPLPARPTFAINLRSYHPDHPPRPDESRNSWLPRDNRGGQKEWWTRFGGEPGWGALTGFAGAIVNAVQNWVDNTQLRVPGYRDRVVHVSLSHDEGGVNLNMPEELITRLGDRGRAAGKKLARRFGPGDDTPLTWDNHRWVRLRSTMQLLEDFLREIRDEYRVENPGERSYEELVQRGPKDPPGSYRWPSAQAGEEADAAMQELMALDFLAREEPLFDEDAPRPTPEIRIRPRL